MIWLLMIASGQTTGSSGSEPMERGRHQAYHDEAAAHRAQTACGVAARVPGEPLPSSVRNIAPPARRWQVVTDADLRARSGYWAPPGYRYHRSVRIDLDLDGRSDVVEMVEHDRQMALRISYGGRPVSRIVARHEGYWTDQGLFAAGRDAVMVNFPESRVYFIFQRGGDIRAEFIGD